MDPAHAGVKVQKKERDVSGFMLQKRPWSPSMPSAASQHVCGLIQVNTTTERNANPPSMVPAQAW